MSIKKITKKIINNLTNPKSICLSILFITIIVLTGLLTSKYYLFQEIIEDGISKRAIFATMKITIIDNEKTKLRQEEMAAKVNSVLKPAYDIVDQNILNDFENVSLSIFEVKDKRGKLNEKKDKIKDILRINKEDKYNTSSLTYLSKCSIEDYNKIVTESKKALSTILEEGISEKEILIRSNQIINKNIKGSLSRIQDRSVALLIKAILKPNMVIDEAATAIIKQNAKNSVKPFKIIYNKDEKIVSKGELVTKIQKDALIKSGYNVSQLDIGGIIGVLSFVGICSYLFAFYIQKFDPVYFTPSYCALFSLLSISIVLFSVLLPESIPPFIIPIPAVTILLTIFTNYRLSMIYTFMLIILLGVSLQYQLEPLSVFFIGAVIAAFASNLISLYRRMDIVRVGLDVGLVQSFLLISVYLLQSSSTEGMFPTIIEDLLYTFASGIVSGIIVLGLLPLIENTFKIISPYGLAELADHNQELLRRLQFEAPGTYHHSLMVSNLAEAASEAIGANPILARVGSFYHDIGKLKRPLFFIENQSYSGIENPHEKLNPKLSKMIITAHPKDGIELAKEYGLPNIIHNFILQHHGDGIATYFYQQAIKEEGIENVSKEQFRYSGQKPTSKEVAILMLADAVESATRAIKSPTKEEIENVIDKIIKERLMDGQLSESPLTQKDLKIIAASFSRILRGMQHQRIQYHDNIIKELEIKPKDTPKDEQEKND